MSGAGIMVKGAGVWNCRGWTELDSNAYSDIVFTLTTNDLKVVNHQANYGGLQ